MGHGGESAFTFCLKVVSPSCQCSLDISQLNYD